MKNKTVIVPIIIILGVLLIDQILKIWVKTHMMIGDEIHIFGDRVMLKFVETREWHSEWNSVATGGN